MLSNKDIEILFFFVINITIFLYDVNIVKSIYYHAVILYIVRR
jgi:hypothetical protein